jgi:hypothetical protein
MNYADHYDRLIERARGRRLDGYRERHHVLPRCMGGGNDLDNIVELTGEEHYVAHQLLVRGYPYVNGLAVAAVRMAKQCTGNKAYAWLRRRVAADARVRETGKKRSPESVEKGVSKLRGRKHTPQAVANMTAASKANAAKGPMSTSQRAHISAAKRGVPRDRVAVEKTATALRGRPRSEETRKKIGDANRGKKLSPRSQETRLKVSAALKGKPWTIARRWSYEKSKHSGLSL